VTARQLIEAAVAAELVAFQARAEEASLVRGVDPEASASTTEMRAALVRETARLLKLGNIGFAGQRGNTPQAAV
jgi:hypothetical protein